VSGAPIFRHIYGLAGGYERAWEVAITICVVALFMLLSMTPQQVRPRSTT